MNEKIAFIICVNNEIYYEECCWYLERLIVPNGFEMDVITIREANSMTEAYNAAMESSDAKYKVYMHQDVFILNQNFIADIVGIFQKDKAIGMLGVIGGVGLPDDAIIYNVWNCGRTITSGDLLTIDTHFYQKEPYILVDALDGMLLATQYDIRWREDILKQWDYYDVSQSLEFAKAGYKLGVPFQDTAWTIHDCGHSNLLYYDENRRIMFEAYPEIFPGSWEAYPFHYNYELNSLTKQIYTEIEALINQGRYQEAEQLLNGFEENGMVRNIVLLRDIFTISSMEKGYANISGILEKNLSTAELLERYTEIKFFLRRLEIVTVSEEELLNWIHVNKISSIEIIINVMLNVFDRERVLRVIGRAYKFGDEIENLKIVENMREKIKKGEMGVLPDSEVIMEMRRSTAEYLLNT